MNSKTVQCRRFLVLPRDAKNNFAILLYSYPSIHLPICPSVHTLVHSSVHSSVTPVSILSQSNKVGYKASQVARGWAGAVMQKLPLNANKAMCDQRTNTSTEQPTVGLTDIWVTCTRVKLQMVHGYLYDFFQNLRCLFDQRLRRGQWPTLSDMEKFL